MERNESVTMSAKLFDLCELQLFSIIKEAETSIFKVTESTVGALKKSTELSQLISGCENKDHKGDHQREVGLCADLEKSFNKILMDMQFFDEFSQRIEHIQQIVDLIKIESGREGFLSNKQDSDKLFNEIKNIFSIKSEFEVMRTIFPEHGETEANNNEVELF